MEDDDEIHSLGSPETGSPASPRPNGRITVTVAAAPPASAQPPQNTLTLALPIQQPRTGGGSAGGSGGGGGGREDCWSEAATAVLIEAWGERYLELSRGNLKQKHWQEVADIVCSREDYGKTPKTDVQCKNRIDTVKKKYKLEKSKIIAGGGPSKWPFFDRLDELIGPSAKIPSIAAATAPKNPVGARSAVHYHHPQKSNPPQKRQMPQPQPLRMRRPAHSVSTESEPESPLSPPSVDSADSFPPERKRPRFRIEPNLNPRPVPVSRDKGWGSSVKELTQAIMKFGEAYEHAETTKMQQVVEIEKQRMRFAKELELQRMQFFMETQVELSQFKRGGGGRRGGGSTSNHQQQQHHHNNTSGKNNRSDSSN